MRRVQMSDLPLERRAEVARDLITHGEDPYLMLAAAVWPSHVAMWIEEPTYNPEGSCSRGHPWTPENTYIRGNGWKKCRACDRLRRPRQRSKSSGYRSIRRKVPCAYCGEPATSAADRGTGGLPTPRCKKCFMEHLRERRRRAA